MKAIALLTAFSAANIAEASAEQLPPERSSLVQVSQFVRYDHLASRIHAGRTGLSARVILGRHVGYAVGLDVDAGATSEGAVYHAELLPVGLGLRAGDAGLISLTAGIGVGGARGDVIENALQLPVELRGRFQLGPVRAMASATMRATPLENARGTELAGALALGWGRQDAYWQGTSAGAGPYVAVGLLRDGDEQTISIALGLELLGAY